VITVDSQVPADVLEGVRKEIQAETMKAIDLNF
jgi:hypothetical protein